MFFGMYPLQNVRFTVPTSPRPRVAVCLQVVGGVPGQQEALVPRVSVV